jgi:hypothetical protein
LVHWPEICVRLSYTRLRGLDLARGRRVPRLAGGAPQRHDVACGWWRRAVGRPPVHHRSALFEQIGTLVRAAHRVLVHVRQRAEIVRVMARRATTVAVMIFAIQARNGITAPALDADMVQYFAHSPMSRRRFSSKAPRR